MLNHTARPITDDRIHSAMHSPGFWVQGLKTAPNSSHLHPGPANSTKRFLCTNHQLPITIHKPVAQPKAFKGELSCTWRAPIFTYLHLSSPKLTYLHQTLCLASTQMDESEPTRTHRR